jgi:hypothetical protein
VFWETVSTEADEPAVFWNYAGIWRAAEKIVYSRTLQTPSSARTRIEREFISCAQSWFGGGKRALPDNVRAQLELLDERRFENGAVHLTTA